MGPEPLAVLGGVEGDPDDPGAAAEFYGHRHLRPASLANAT
jgi:hypothetical protein